MIKFSVIIPIYNVEKYLKRCVDSVLEQSYKNIEIILVDDGSSDNCPKICDEYAHIDDRVKVIHKENGGLSDARNAGMELATGDYILFVDSDDYIEIDACEKFSHFAHKGYDILIGDALVENGKCNLSHIFSNDVLNGMVYYKNALKARKAPVAVWLNAYKRKFLIQNALKFKPGILHEDVEFTPRAIIAAESVICTNIVFYHYVIRDNSIMRQKDQRKNAIDLYNTCREHEIRFQNIEDKELRKLILNSLVCSYLSLFQSSQMYKYGRDYIHKDFCVRNAYNLKTKLKSGLFNLSPRLYWYINTILKRGFQ